MSLYNQIIFVCSTGNCRGPMAEEIMKSMLLYRPVEICSRGLVVLFPEPVNQKAEAVMISNGLSVENHMSVQLVEKDFREDCLVIALDKEIKQKINKEYQNACNVYTFQELLDEEGHIVDPYGGTLTDYGACFEMLYRFVSILVDRMNREEL